MEKFDYSAESAEVLQRPPRHPARSQRRAIRIGNGPQRQSHRDANPDHPGWQGGGMLKTGRYVRYAKNQQLGRLAFDACYRNSASKPNRIGESSNRCRDWMAPTTNPIGNARSRAWVRQQDGTDHRPRSSSTVGQPRRSQSVFFVDVEGGRSVRIEVAFRDFHDFNLAYHCGTPIKLTGTGTEKAGQLLITKITDLQSLFGKNRARKTARFCQSLILAITPSSDAATS